MKKRFMRTKFLVLVISIVITFSTIQLGLAGATDWAYEQQSTWSNSFKSHVKIMGPVVFSDNGHSGGYSPWVVEFSNF